MRKLLSVIMLMLITACSHVHHYDLKHYEAHCFVVPEYEKSGELHAINVHCPDVAAHEQDDERKK